MKCPKCGVEIKRFDLSPNCKKCGVHIMYYTQEEDLAYDAKKTELEFAKARVFVARLKAAFIKGKLPITRMVFMVLIILCLLLPFATLSIQMPMFSKDVTLSALGFYELYSNGMLSHILELPSLGVAPNVFILTLAGISSYILMVLSGVAVFAVWLLSFINLKKSSNVLVKLSTVAGFFDILTMVLSVALVLSAKEYTLISASFGFGGIVTLIIFAVFMFINIKMFVNDEPLSIKDIDLQRLEIAAKVKSGELSLSDLPVPILESEEERNARINAFGENKTGGKENE